jgi:hypothetical protein
MKKLYFLNEEEKNRILNLHESATKRQYLSEQQGQGETQKIGNAIDGSNTAAGTTTTAPAGTTTTTPAGTTTTVPAVTTTTTPSTWSPDPNGNKTWEYQFKDNSWFARKKGTTKEYNISKNKKYASSVNTLNTRYPDAIKPVSTTTPTNTTLVNTVVGGDASSEAAKKTAEAGVQNKDSGTPKVKSSEAPLANNGGFAETKFDDLYS